MRVKVNGVDVESFALIGEHDEHDLDGVQALLVTQLVAGN